LAIAAVSLPLIIVGWLIAIALGYTTFYQAFMDIYQPVADATSGAAEHASETEQPNEDEQSCVDGSEQSQAEEHAQNNVQQEENVQQEDDSRTDNGSR
jgi:archaellum component FlaF (FlaF/FlaG flagellin family)